MTTTTETSPTARALLALELVQSRPGITADGLAERLGVTARAARRYVAILREAGIPIVSVSGPAGGYRPGRGLRPPPLLFTADEALGLVMAVLDGHHDAASAEDPVGTALGKILRSLPEAVAARAKAVRHQAAPAPDRGAARPRPDHTVALVEACAEVRRVRLGYRSEAGADLDLEVDPWAVVIRHSRWYLLCRSVRADAIRAYRVDRVRSVTAVGEGVAPPADLDPVAALEEHLAAGWDHEVEIVIDAPLERVARCVPRTLGRLEPVEEGRTRLVGSTSNPAWYAEELARVPAPFRVLGSPAVNAAVAALGARLVAAASGGGSEAD